MVPYRSNRTSPFTSANRSIAKSVFFSAAIRAKLTKRSVDLRFVDFSAKPQKMGGDKLKLVAPVKNGIDSDNAKKIQAAIKASKLKVQASIQGDTVRVTGGKRDDLQAAIALLRKDIALPLAFQNFRD